MKGCGFCHKCDLRYCPKKGRVRPMFLKQVPLSVSMHDRLHKFCEKRKFMRGEEYYKVPDFDAALAFLLKEYSGKRNWKRRRRA